MSTCRNDRDLLFGGDGRAKSLALCDLLITRFSYVTSKPQYELFRTSGNPVFIERTKVTAGKLDEGVTG